MILVEGGTFQMGDEVGDLDSSCRPAHTVNLTYDYWIGRYEVTFNEYDAFCDATGRSKPGDEGWGRGQRPVINVTWWDAIAYCNWLSDQEGYARAYDLNGNLRDKSGNITTDITQVEGYRLPTEAEWEYAARGGKYSHGYRYSGSNNLNEVGWYDANSGYLGLTTHSVGEKAANELGLCDASGNVFEWCHDKWDIYTSSAQTNPIGTATGSFRVDRGGSWDYYPQSCRVAYRSNDYPEISYYCLGFRVARTEYRDFGVYLEKLPENIGFVIKSEEAFTIAENVIIEFSTTLNPILISAEFYPNGSIGGMVPNPIVLENGTQVVFHNAAESLSGTPLVVTPDGVIVIVIFSGQKSGTILMTMFDNGGGHERPLSSLNVPLTFGAP